MLGSITNTLKTYTCTQTSVAHKITPEIPTRRPNYKLKVIIVGCGNFAHFFEISEKFGKIKRTPPPPIFTSSGRRWRSRDSARRKVYPSGLSVNVSRNGIWTMGHVTGGQSGVVKSEITIFGPCSFTSDVILM